MTTIEQITNAYSSVFNRINTNFTRLNSKISAINSVQNATNATNDGGGNNIANTYATKAELLAVSDGLIKVCTTLPVDNISTSTFYLVPNDSSETNNTYDEYVYLNNNWELVGQKEIDLSDYYSKTEVDSIFTGIANSGLNTITALEA